VDTPAEVQIKTPETFLPANPSSSQPKSSLVTKIFGSSNKKEQTHPALLEQGITGADFTQPLFDGTSMNPHDHLIDIDTPSMETCPDVRVYFYLIGECFDVLAGIERPEDHEGRIKHDARVVRAGREYLKYCRSLGAGFVLSLFCFQSKMELNNQILAIISSRYTGQECARARVLPPAHYRRHQRLP
jgi:hypothetical protein